MNVVTFTVSLSRGWSLLSWICVHSFNHMKSQLNL